MSFMSFLSPGAGLGELFEHDAERYAHCLRLSKRLMTGPSELDRSERELIAAYVSSLNACAFCAGTHGAIARSFGWNEETLKALLDDEQPSQVPEKLWPLLKYVRQLTTDPARLTQVEVNAVVSAGWSEDALSDAIAIAAYYSMVNRLASGHGIEALSAVENEAIGRHIRDHGYPETP